MGKLITTLETFGRFCLLSWEVIRRSFFSVRSFFDRLSESINQTYKMGVESIPIVSLISFFIGMILAIQTAYQLQKFGATIYVSSLVLVSVVRELGPLLTAILVAGRVGAGITAELGSMVVNEEVTALRMMAMNPKKFLLVPRLIGLVVALPILTLLGDMLAFVGGMIVGWGYLNIPFDQFYRTGMDALIMKDVLTGFAKSVVFAFLIALIASYKGFTVTGGATGVGKSTTDTVVLSIIYIIFADLLFTFLFYFL